MKRVFTFITTIFTISIFISGCGEDEMDQSSSGLYYFTNLDQYYGFLEPYSLNKVAYAHSGDYVSKTDPGCIYSFAFKRKRSEITSNPLKSVEVNCYVYAEKSNPNCALVCVANIGDNPPLFFTSYPLNGVVTTPKQWQKISNVFALDNTIPQDSYISVFLMNQDSSAVYLDDLSVKFIEKK